MNLTSGFVLSLSLLCGGCLYGFSGGGLPPEVKTVAVLPFDNLTTDPALTEEVNTAVREALERRLGLRQSGENTADAVVRGTISRYEADVPVAVASTGAGQVDVARRLVQITLSIEIVNQRDGTTLWQRQGMQLEGDYSGGEETQGRRKALERLTTNIVDGAQSQW